MFTNYLKWWDNHVWVAILIVALVLVGSAIAYWTLRQK